MNRIHLCIAILVTFVTTEANADLYKCDGVWTNRPCQDGATPAIRVSPLKQGAIKDILDAFNVYRSVGVDIDTAPLLKICDSVNTTTEQCQKAAIHFMMKNEEQMYRGDKALRSKRILTAVRLAEEVGILLDADPVIQVCEKASSSVDACAAAAKVFLRDNKSSLEEASKRLIEQDRHNQLQAQVRAQFVEEQELRRHHLVEQQRRNTALETQIEQQDRMLEQQDEALRRQRNMEFELQELKDRLMISP